MIKSVQNKSSNLQLISPKRHCAVEESNHTHLTKIGIVGAGVTGTSIAIMMARVHIKNNSTDCVRISLIDDNKPGLGIPYRAYSQDETLAQTYMLNQPNNRMSFDPADPLEFCRYINPQNPEQVADEFSTRNAYGQFVESALHYTKRSLANINSKCSIDWVNARVHDIAEQSDVAEVISDKGVSYLEDIVVVATGHSYSSFMAPLKSAPGFFDFPCDLDDLKETLKGQNNGVLVIGTSQSQIDAIASLQAIGYEGKIHSISRRNITPWEFIPEHHQLDFDLSRYTFSALTPEAIASTDLSMVGQPGSEERLLSLLEKEVALSKAQHIGTGFVYAKVLSKEMQRQLSQVQSDDTQKFLSFVAAKFGNPTPSPRFSMLQSLQNAGTLSIHKGAVSAETLTQNKAGQFTLEGVDSLKNSKFDAVLNGAAFARAPIDSAQNLISPLFSRMAERGLLKPFMKNNFQAGQQSSRIYMANGPSTNLHKWGIETFRGQNSEIAHDIILNRSNEQNKGNQQSSVDLKQVLSS